MTQLLISVKNLEESRLARDAGVDLIDLKDPVVGALGALDVDTVQQIVRDVNGQATVSATVGEGHANIETLVGDVKHYTDLGVDIVKIAVSDLFHEAGFFAELKQVTSQGTKVVVVFFADQVIDLGLMTQLKNSGCYGAMLDTQTKQHALLSVQSVEALKRFVLLCADYGLVSGLAGSVNKQHVKTLHELSPSFIGMRGGVCKQQDRATMLVKKELAGVKALLLKCNSKFN